MNIKFLIDAQLPKRLSNSINELGCFAIHTLDLPNRNFTSDQEIISLSLKEQLIVISKDADFYNSFLLKAEPYKLIYLKVGNMRTDELIQIFQNNFPIILEQISQFNVIEISNKNIITII